ncbi:MAG: LacI family transcriptional regulator [Phycisphaerales bacterium]|nr:LacI family transcriptional regulator [Phycisphaerales bacterium]
MAIRRPNGRIELNPDYEQRGEHPCLALLAPAWVAPNIDRWRFMLNQAIAKSGHQLRPIDYVHWDDPVIGETLAKFRGVFLMPNSEPIPPSILARLAAAGQLVVIEHDLSAHGIVSLSLYPPQKLHMLLEYVLNQGWPDLACLNVQPVDGVIQARIEHWQSACWLRKIKGQLHNHPVAPYTPTIEHAHRVVSRLLPPETFAGKAVFCTTMAATLGASRALHDLGLKVGRDVAIYTLNGEDLHAYITPSLCCLEPTQPMELLTRCVDWLVSPKPHAWEGPRLLEPLHMKLYPGETVQPFEEITEAPVPLLEIPAT